MKKIVLLGLIGMSLISCQKENKVILKYAYITRDNIEYANDHYKVITTQLCSYDKTLTRDEIIAEQSTLMSSFSSPSPVLHLWHKMPRFCPVV